jgi:cell division protein FtsI/penicillin-binding protein 2
MLGRTDSRARLVVLVGIIAILGSLLGMRLAYWQIGMGPELRAMADAELVQPQLAAVVQRGQILDRGGAVLATSAYRDMLAAYPDQIEHERVLPRMVDRLASILGYDEDQRAGLRAALESDRPYVILSRRLTEEQSTAIRADLASGELAQLELVAQPVRYYPNSGGAPDTTLASQLLGFVTEDGQGRYGVEQAGHSLLSGAESMTADVSGTAPLPRPGGNIQLTIDASLQLRLESELYAAWVANRSTRVSGVVMDPYSGAILAWASVPGYDANNYAQTAESAPQLFTDPIASQVYEPGSVMKMFTAAAALEERVVNLGTLVEDARQLRIGPNVVRNFDRRSMGTITFADVIAHSRNVATGQVALALGRTPEQSAQILYDMWQRLGIGHPTGIELGGEAAGLVSDPAEQPWHQIDLVNRAFGQAVAVTPLQLVASFAAMVNGGTLPTPHIFAPQEGEALAVPSGPQVLSPELSATLRDLMVHVVQEGPHYAEETLIPGYVVGGKTGTAQIWDNEAGAWLDNVYNHTFVGFVGAERPEAVVLVRVHETEPYIRKRWGMSLLMSSNELFRRVARDVISVLDIPPLPGSPTLPEEPEPEPEEEPAPEPSVRPGPVDSGLPSIVGVPDRAR